MWDDDRQIDIKLERRDRMGIAEGQFAAFYR